MATALISSETPIFRRAHFSRLHIQFFCFFENRPSPLKDGASVHCSSTNFLSSPTDHYHSWSQKTREQEILGKEDGDSLFLRTDTGRFAHLIFHHRVNRSGDVVL